MKAENYYYNLLGKEEKQAYHAIRTGLLGLEASFPVPRLDGATLANLYFQVRMDCPEIFYTVNFTYRFYANAETVEMVPEYLMKKKQILAHREAMASRVKKLARPAAEKSDWDKLLYIHDFICSGVRYDKLKKPYSHEIIGPLGQGVGVCEGIAKAVKILCDELGVWCILALSEANPEKGIKYRHAWNVVRVDGKLYHLDATFDNSLSGDGVTRYDYFCLGDAQLFRDHEPVIWPIPACTDTGHFYYKQQKLSLTKPEEVRSRAQQAARKGRPLVFHWRGGYLTREVLTELMGIVSDAAAERGRYARLSLNWPQAVLRLTFPEDDPAGDIVMEEANEGEIE